MRIGGDAPDIDDENLESDDSRIEDDLLQSSPEEDEGNNFSSIDPRRNSIERYEENPEKIETSRIRDYSEYDDLMEEINGMLAAGKGSGIDVDNNSNENDQGSETFESFAEDLLGTSIENLLRSSRTVNEEPLEDIKNLIDGNVETSRGEMMVAEEPSIAKLPSISENLSGEIVEVHAKSSTVDSEVSIRGLSETSSDRIEDQEENYRRNLSSNYELMVKDMSSTETAQCNVVLKESDREISEENTGAFCVTDICRQCYGPLEEKVDRNLMLFGSFCETCEEMINESLFSDIESEVILGYKKLDDHKTRNGCEFYEQDFSENEGKTVREVPNVYENTVNSGSGTQVDGGVRDTSSSSAVRTEQSKNLFHFNWNGENLDKHSVGNLSNSRQEATMLNITDDNTPRYQRVMELLR
ncbi:hypothetical protein QAD02_021889 [Eretmocerus hayati]|uniref:Uncharacterized protein n=1 Tax=Eretmocerus hayati TaxID=131215 RepID=A0ACC2PR60_9HYME|nr:hypothetical protein QAD02_021889 [Eretmocerus hayati]